MGWGKQEGGNESGKVIGFREKEGKAGRRLWGSS